MITYKSLSWIGDDFSLLRAEELIIDDVSYGTQLIGAKTDIGVKLIQHINDNDIVLPVEETGAQDTEVTDEIFYNIVRDCVQVMLDEKAQEKNYDNGFALSTYANSTIQSFKSEALKYIEWRDQCWAKCYEMLDDYQSGKIERPSLDDVMSQMPTLEW